MANSTLNIRIDTETKDQAQQLFDSLGLNLSTAINLFLHQAIREQAIPFRVGEPLPNAVTLAAIEDAANGRDIHGPFASVEALMEDLNADD